MPYGRARTVLKWPNGVIDFDAVELESPTHEVQITEYPVEAGAALVDHVRMRAVQLRLNVVLSNTPMPGAFTSHDAASGQLLRRLPRGMDSATLSTTTVVQVREPLLARGLPASVAGVALSESVPVQALVQSWDNAGQRVLRAQNVFAELKQAMMEAREFTVATDMFGEYDRMLIKALRTDRDGATGNALRLAIEMQQLSYALLSRRDVSALLPRPKAPRSEKPKDQGKMQPDKADEHTKRRVSVVKRGLRGIGKALGEP